MTKNKNDQDIIVLLKQSVKEAIREEGLVTREDLKYLPTKEDLEKIHPAGQHFASI